MRKKDMIPINERHHATGKYFQRPNLQVEQMEREIDKTIQRRRYSTPGGNLYDPRYAPTNSEQITIMFHKNQKPECWRHISANSQSDLVLETESADVEFNQDLSCDVKFNQVQYSDSD
jgi:hypothetical protein